jgi:endonuclease/exonuclease/phosphatase family metal-dependent hydrolase
VWLQQNIGRGDQRVRSAAWASSDEAFTVATFNVLGNSHTGPGGKAAGMASGPVRMRGVAKLLVEHRIDVVGFQEFQRPQAITFSRLVGGTYARWSPRGDTENSIAYRRERWSLVAADTVAIPYFGGRIRRMPVVRLRDRATGEQVVFVNVHNPADTRRFRQQGHWRAAAVNREVALVRKLSNQTPVILTGDLNDRRDAFCRLASRAGMSSSAGGSGSPCSPPRGGAIDWILGSSRVAFSNHTSDRSRLVRATTDHPVLFARARVAR